MADAHDEDSGWMLRVAADEPGAFERLVPRVLPRLLGYLRRLGADSAQAEDLAQDVFLKIYRARKAYVARARFLTYLLHVARNHWIDVLRHRRLGPTTISADRVLPSRGEEETLGASLPGREQPPESGADRGHLAQALDEALSTLGPEQREIFVLAHLHTLRYEEIAEIVGIPVGTVKSRVHAAVHALRALLTRRGIEP